jgi:hypothetical protein
MHINLKQDPSLFNALQSRVLEVYTDMKSIELAYSINYLSKKPDSKVMDLLSSQCEKLIEDIDNTHAFTHMLKGYIYYYYI